MKLTNIFKFNKPDYDDKADIDIINQNFDKLDSELNFLSVNKADLDLLNAEINSLKTQLNELDQNKTLVITGIYTGTSPGAGSSLKQTISLGAKPKAVYAAARFHSGVVSFSNESPYSGLAVGGTNVGGDYSSSRVGLEITDDGFVVQSYMNQSTANASPYRYMAIM